MVIRMMGGLSLSRDGKTVATSDSRMKKVWTLIAYLVLHRNDPISLEELTGILWNGSECNNPSNALKNLAYRSRRMMEPLHREGEGEFIIFANGVYLWNPDIPCRVDCEEMEECYRRLLRRSFPRKSVWPYWNRGLMSIRVDFLPRLAFNQWAAEQCHYYQTIEEKSVLLSAELLQTVGREKSIIGLAQWAVRSQPLSGTFQAMLIRTHLAAGNYTRALEQYNTAADLFYRQKAPACRRKSEPFINSCCKRLTAPILIFPLSKKNCGKIPSWGHFSAIMRRLRIFTTFRPGRCSGRGDFCTLPCFRFTGKMAILLRIGGSARR